jgi:hypothetical protein
VSHYHAKCMQFCVKYSITAVDGFGSWLLTPCTVRVQGKLCSATVLVMLVLQAYSRRSLRYGSIVGTQPYRQQQHLHPNAHVTAVAMSNSSVLEKKCNMEEQTKLYI